MRLKRGVPSSAWQRSRGPGTNVGELASASEFAPRGPPHPRVVLILLRDLRVLFLLPHHGDHLTATGPQLQSTARPPPLPEPLHPLPRELSPRRAQDQLRAGPAWRNDPEDQLRPSSPPQRQDWWPRGAAAICSQAFDFHAQQLRTAEGGVSCPFLPWGGRGAVPPLLSHSLLPFPRHPDHCQKPNTPSYALGL